MWRHDMIRPDIFLHSVHVRFCDVSERRLYLSIQGKAGNTYEAGKLNILRWERAPGLHGCPTSPTLSLLIEVSIFLASSPGLPRLNPFHAKGLHVQCIYRILANSRFCRFWIFQRWWTIRQFFKILYNILYSYVNPLSANITQCTRYPEPNLINEFERGWGSEVTVCLLLLNSNSLGTISWMKL